MGDIECPECGTWFDNYRDARYHDELNHKRTYQRNAEKLMELRRQNDLAAVLRNSAPRPGSENLGPTQTEIDEALASIATAIPNV